jgi:hypothetical protein
VGTWLRRADADDPSGDHEISSCFCDHFCDTMLSRGTRVNYRRARIISVLRVTLVALIAG